MTNEQSGFKSFRHAVVALLLFPLIAFAADNKREESEAKVVTGMSIVGNNETPKSLYIIPWKTAETGKEVSFSTGISNTELSPLDKSDFIRELDFYKQSNRN